MALIMLSKPQFFFTLVSSLASLTILMAADPNILSDFILPPGVNTIDGTFFTFAGMRSVVSGPNPTTFKVSKASMTEFPALNGQSVSYALLQFPAGSVNPPHTHPRASELLFLVQGSLEVGFVDTTNKLFTQTLQKGDIFVFPKGLVHFQYNSDPKSASVAISGFGSANSGLQSVPNSIFNSTIDDGILASSFKTDVATIQKLKAGLASKP